jgi:hypothetical protein
METIVLLGIALLDSPISKEIIGQDGDGNRPADASELGFRHVIQDAFGEARRGAPQVGHPLFASDLQYQHWDVAESTSHGRIGLMLEWINQNEAQLRTLRANLKAHLTAGNYSDCNSSPQEVMELFEAAQLIWKRRP